MLFKRTFGWLCTVPALGAAAAVLILLHPVLVILKPLSLRLYRKTLDIGSFLILCAVRLTGAKFLFKCDFALPSSGPLIIVSNHQSLVDIPLLDWLFRDVQPRFIAKQELSRWIPTVSHGLRNTGSAIIDRTNPSRALATIQTFAEDVARTRHAAVIFPEGTRSRDGKVRYFKTAGLLELMKKMPTAPVVCTAIKGSWELMKYGMRPIPFGTEITVSVVGMYSREKRDNQDIIRCAEEDIRKCVGA